MASGNAWRWQPLGIPMAGLLAVLLCASSCSCPPGVYDDTRDYYLPYAYDTTWWVGQGNNGLGDVCPDCSHFGKYAIDLVMDEGTAVLAARPGVVSGTRDTCPDVNCPWAGSESPDCCGNYVKILHDDGTTAKYWHLMPAGVLVETGDEVARGDPIGLSGNTGISIMPHLHFSVGVAAGSTVCAAMGCLPGHGCGEWGCSEDTSTEVTFADVCDSGIPQFLYAYTSRNGSEGAVE